MPPAANEEDVHSRGRGASFSGLRRTPPWRAEEARPRRGESGSGCTLQGVRGRKPEDRVRNKDLSPERGWKRAGLSAAGRCRHLEASSPQPPRRFLLVQSLVPPASDPRPSTRPGLTGLTELSGAAGAVVKRPVAHTLRWLGAQTPWGPPRTPRGDPMETPGEAPPAARTPPGAVTPAGGPLCGPCPRQLPALPRVLIRSGPGDLRSG